MKIKKFNFIFLTIPLTLFICHPLIAEDSDEFWEEFIQLRESKLGKNEKYLNKLTDCRKIADNFLKLKKEEDNFNKRVWAVSNCMKDYEAIMEVKKMIK